MQTIAYTENQLGLTIFVKNAYKYHLSFEQWITTAG